MKKITFLLSIFLSTVLYSQIPVDTWRDHYSFINVLGAWEINSDSYVLASENGLCYFDNDFNYQKLTKTNGLSDVGISAVEYDLSKDILIVAYQNGNIDIVSDQQILNIADIKRKSISGNKKINSITVEGDYAYLSCSFGIIKIDIVNAEIVDTYYIGAEASYVNVYKTVILEDSIFAATDLGLYAADIDNVLADFNNWQILNTPYPSFYDLTIFNNSLYAIVAESSAFRCVKKTENSWIIVKKYDINSQSRLFSYNNLFIATGYYIFELSKEGTLIQTISKYSDEIAARPQFVSITENGKLLIGDSYFGLVINDEEEFSFFNPDGTYSNEIFKVSSFNNYTVVTRGGFNSAGVNLWRHAYVNYFSENQWNYYVKDDCRDLNCILRDESNPAHFYIGSWGYGLLEFLDGEVINHYKEGNSPLVPIIAGPYIRISGLDFDDDKNVWMINRAILNPVNVLKPDGNWVSLQINEISDQVTGPLIHTDENLIFAVLPNKGLMILDYNNTLENQNDDIAKAFYPRDEEGSTIGSEIFCIAEDKKGDIWFGTNEGVGVFYDTQNFTDPAFTATRIKITAELNDSLVTDYLLKKQSVLCVAIDGGNRKWFGTESAGAFLINETGTEELLHFDTENSPLPSNKIYSIAVDNLTGEVFFATDNGLVSYRGDATEANDEFQNVYVFPNPVRPDYTGLITVTGLIYQTNVKITDIAGNIVYETTSEGGQATWDGNNFDGKRVQTGVYIVFCSNDDGSKTHITKLLFIN